MLTIRPEQYEVFAEAEREKFLGRMEAHLRSYFKPAIGHLDSPQCRQVISRNWKRAEEYGLTSELGVCTYLETVCTFGEAFPEAEPWASSVLLAKCDENQKLEYLNDRILKRAYLANGGKE